MSRTNNPLLDYFPEAHLGQFSADHNPSAFQFHYQGQLWEIPNESLTEREQWLLSEILETDDRVMDPWLAFFKGKSNHLPEKLDTYQLVYVNHLQPLPEELLGLIETLLDTPIARVALAKTRTAFVLRQGLGSDFVQTLKAVQPTIESDFGLSLTFVVGNTWSHLEVVSLKQVLQAEDDLVSHYLLGQRSMEVQGFSDLLLWAISNQVPATALTSYLTAMIDKQDGLAALVKALWANHGNQVQAAQQLFLHRNSLQYQMDKWYRLSGLQLKHLDDLTLCYLLLLER